VADSCLAIAKSGQRCRLPALKTGSYCRVHDAQSSHLRREAGGEDGRSQHRDTRDPSITSATIPAPNPPAEIGSGNELGSLARELGHGHRELVTQFQRYAGMELAEATEMARAPRQRALKTLETTTPEQLTWTTMAQAMEHDPDAVLATWNRVRSAARDELQSGHRTAQSLEWGHRPWDRARFLAVHNALHDDWGPRNAVEAAMVDLLAQNFSAYLLWTERLTKSAASECRDQDSRLAREGYWVPPRVSEAKWMDWCSEQANAAHRRFLMTLKSLQDLRRPSISIASAGQVNIAQQAVNVSQACGTEALPDDFGKS
jgi:hypothetical protein